MRTALGSLDAIVGEDAEGGVQFSGAALDRLRRSADGQDGVAELGHRCICGGRGFCHLIHHRGGLVCTHAQGGHGIRHHVGGRGQVDAARRRQVEDGGERVAHFLGVIPGESQVVQCLGAFAGGEGRLAAHLLCQGGEGVHGVHALAVDRGHGVLGDAHGGLHLGHGGLEAGGGGDSGAAKAHHRGGDRLGKGFAHPGHLIAHSLELVAHLSDFLKSDRRIFRLPLQILEFLFGFDDLPLEGVILRLGDLPVGEGLIGLLRCRFQRGQFLLGLRDGLAQQPVLLRQQLRVAGVQLEQLIDIPEAALGGGEGLVHIFEGGGQLCGIAADLHHDARDPSCTHRPSPPIRNGRNLPVSPGSRICSHR